MKSCKQMMNVQPSQLIIYLSEVIFIFLYHYFDESIGPFVSLSDLPKEEANSILRKLKTTKPKSKSAQRDEDYINRRHQCENIIRTEFVKKGGVILRDTPHYMVIGPCSWLSSWYDNSSFVRIAIEEFDTRSISFTYGDSMPTFHPFLDDGKEYRKKVYTYREILRLIRRYGLPQDWNEDGRYGPERYIEAHIWSDEPIEKYRNGQSSKCLAY